MKAKAYWHIHHDTLLEFTTKPIKNRIKYIKNNKPVDEIKIRLKLLKSVKGTLPDELIETWEKTREAGARVWNVWEAWEAHEAWEKAYNDSLPDIMKLHEKECPNCLWDGKTIFGKGKKGKA